MTAPISHLKPAGEATPTPWAVQDYSECDDGVGIIGLRTNNGVPYPSPTNGLVAWATLHPTEMDANDATRAQANAAFIVEAVNSHASLKARNEELTKALDAECEQKYKLVAEILDLKGKIVALQSKGAA